MTSPAEELYLDMAVKGGADKVSLAISLMGLGLRFPYVRAATGLSDYHLRTLITATKATSPSGQMPSSEKWFLNGQSRHHTSLFLDLYMASEESGISSAFRYLSAYAVYLCLTRTTPETALLDPNRAWHSIQLCNSHMLRLMPCTRCGRPNVVTYLSLRTDCVCFTCARVAPASPPNATPSSADEASE